MSNSLPSISDTVAGYTLVKMVGEGAFGEVYKGIDSQGNVAALKFVKDVSALDQFQRLVKVQQQLDSPHVAKILHHQLDSQPAFVVMELVEGCTFRQLINALPDDPRQREAYEDIIYYVLLQVAAALKSAHDQDICHLDLKPSNVLLSYRGDVKLTDFEFSRSLSGELSLSLATRDGIAGTLPYMSPEQRRGQKADAKSDVYTFGVMLFEALVGELPQPGDSPSDFIDSMSFNEIFNRSFARPQKRYENGAQLYSAMVNANRASKKWLKSQLMHALTKLGIDNKPSRETEYWSPSLPVQKDLLPTSVKLIKVHHSVDFLRFIPLLDEKLIHSQKLEAQHNLCEQLIFQRYQGDLTQVARKSGVGSYYVKICSGADEVLFKSDTFEVTPNNSLHPSDVAKRKREAARQKARAEAEARRQAEQAERERQERLRRENWAKNYEEPPIWAGIMLLSPIFIAVGIVLINLLAHWMT